jgi:hypothetical protein
MGNGVADPKEHLANFKARDLWKCFLRVASIQTSIIFVNYIETSANINRVFETKAIFLMELCVKMVSRKSQFATEHSKTSFEFLENNQISILLLLRFNLCKQVSSIPQRFLIDKVIVGIAL